MQVRILLNRLTLAITVAGVCGLGAAAQTSAMKSDSATARMDTADRAFVKKAAQGGMAEVELGKLATERASDPDVKKFGERMVNDNTKANDQLKEVASSKNVTLPKSLDAKDEATKKRLSSLSGAAFDRAYMTDMVTDHTKDVAEFRRGRLLCEGRCGEGLCHADPSNSARPSAGGKENRARNSESE